MQIKAGYAISSHACRALARCGIIAGLGFALAIGFNTVTILLTPTCWSIPA